MPSINVEGLGVIEIEGDTPNEIEQNAILGALSENEEEAPIEPEVPVEPEVPAEPEEGPLGLIPAETRGKVRETIENQPGILQFLAEASPSVGGALAGGAAGSLLGPFGTIGGAIAGGLAGETVAQETGVAPESELNLALSAAGPVLGPAVGATFKGGRRLLGAISTKIPFAAAARSKNTVGSVVQEFESMGTRILDKQTGLVSRKASEIYDAVRKAGVRVPGKTLNNTRDAISNLVQEMNATKSFPEVRQALNHLKKVSETISSGKASTILGPTGKPITVANDISIDTLVALRQQLGVAVRRAESAGGVKLGSAKKVFATISDDLDKIATDPSLTGRAARLAKAAVQRAKLEFSVKDMEMAVARFTKDIDSKQGVGINIKGFQKWFRDITNPKSKQFSKNFTEALKDDIPTIKKRVDVLAKILGASGSGGPGSLVIRGRLTTTAVGAMAGLGFGGPFGGAVGAFAGANAPEMLTSMLTSKAGAAFLESAANLGKGELNIRTWIAAGEAATRSLGEKQ